MGNVRTYRMGKKHGREGIRHMAHRQCRMYDSKGAQRSYNDGYMEGAKERQEKDKKVGLDYSRPENNQDFSNS